MAKQKRLDEAIAHYEKGLEVKSEDGWALSNLAFLYLEKGQHLKALEMLRHAMSCKPTNHQIHSNLLFVLCHIPEIPPENLLAEHRLWEERHGYRGPILPATNDPTPERRLRIGYVSPDLRNHAVARFFTPVLTNHDPAQIEMTCYANVLKPDDVSRQMEAVAPRWRWIGGLEDQTVVDMIRADGIDILVDLAGHTARHSLRAFTFRPAPVQVTWLGYPNTTGLSCMDYLLTDAILHPPGKPSYGTEELVRLEKGIVPFVPLVQTPDVGPLPARTAGHVTFGSFHKLLKINEHVIATWCRLLQRLPTARLIVFRTDLESPEVRQELSRKFVERGIPSERVDFRYHHPSNNYFNVHNEVDIQLDVFPYTGGTTIFESLWMGVPVLTLAGRGMAERVGASTLHRVNLSEFITTNLDDYLDRAVALAGNLDRLAEIQAGLREVTLNTVCDGTGFTRCLEEAYRTMWRKWCMRGGESRANGTNRNLRISKAAIQRPATN